jgi:hypothetical protein
MYVRANGVTVGPLGTGGTGCVTSGASIVYGDGAGGCTNVVIGSGLTFSGGTLTSSGSGITQLTGAVTAGPGSGSQATTLAANAVGTSNIANSAVTLAKIANAAANSKLLGAGAAGTGAPYAELTLGTNLSMSGTTLNATGGGTPGGSNGQLQINSSGSFGGVIIGPTLVNNSGTLDVSGSVVAGTTQTVTTSQWSAGTTFVVTTAAQTLTLPVSSTLSANGGIAIQTIGQSVTLAPNAADAINGGTAGASITIASGLTAYVTTNGSGAIRVSPTTNSGSGTVTTSGTPTSGNLAKFSGSTVVTNGDLTGDCTTSGTLATTCAMKVTPLALGTSVTLTAPRQYYVCTGACTVTPPVPAAGYEFCVRNGNNISTVITLAAVGSSVQYENTASTAFGTAGTGTLVSAGAVGDKVCIVGRDSTHYLVFSYNGTWTAN